MVVTTYSSLDGRQVRVSVERKSASEVFGREMVSGGLRDYSAHLGQGFWIVAKAGWSPTQLPISDLLRQAVYKALGSYPVVMPESHASHLVVLLWEGETTIEESEVLFAIGDALRETTLLDRDKLEKMRTEMQRLYEIQNEHEHKRQAEEHKKISQFEHDALRVVYEGLQRKYLNKYESTFKMLAERGLLRKKGLVQKEYALTEAGIRAMEESKHA